MIAKAVKRIWIIAACLTVLATSAFAVDPGSDPVGYTVEQMKSFSSNFQVPVTEFEQLMKQVFAEEPRLYYYMTGYSYTSDASGVNVTMGYQHTDVPIDDVWVVNSPEQLYSAIGLAEYENSQSVSIIAQGDFVNETVMDEAFATLQNDYYLLSMPYHGDSYTFSRDENFGTGLTALDISLIFWDGVDSQTAAQWKNDTENAVLQLAGSLFAQDMPDWMKEYLIHDYLVDNNRYDSYTPDAAVRHVAYSALCEGSTVCQGYTEAARLLMEAAGIPCYFVSGESEGESHSWNCVEIGGAWYMLDITWDDPVMSDGSDAKQYDYFNVTSAQLAQDHTWDTSTAPECTATAMNGEAVYALLTADQGGYSDYSDRLVRTQQIQHDELAAKLGMSTDSSSDEQGNTETGTAPEGTPPNGDTTGEDGASPAAGETQPTEENPSESADPAAGELQDTLGIIPSFPEEEETETRSGFSAGTAVLWLIVIALLAGAAVLITRMTASRRVEEARAERREFRVRRLRSSSQRGRSFRS